MNALAFRDLLQTINSKFGVHDVACPLCGPNRRAPANRTREVLRVWHVSSDFVSYACARCGETGYARDLGAPRINANIYARVSAELEEDNRAAAAVRRRKALNLWRSRQPLRGSIGEVYLRGPRAYRGPLPPTLGFLPARGEYSPAIIAAFGIPDEPEPGVMILPDRKVKGVHLTRLARGGRDRERGDRAKIMIGFSSGNPIVLAPSTDSQGLVVTEGIEDALSAYETTGLSTWAAGSASRLPSIVSAVPNWVECVTILADNDDAGKQHATAFARALKKRSAEIRLIVLGGAEA